MEEEEEEKIGRDGDLERDEKEKKKGGEGRGKERGCFFFSLSTTAKQLLSLPALRISDPHKRPDPPTSPLWRMAIQRTPPHLVVIGFFSSLIGGVNDMEDVLNWFFLPSHLCLLLSSS